MAIEEEFSKFVVNTTDEIIAKPVKSEEARSLVEMIGGFLSSVKDKASNMFSS